MSTTRYPSRGARVYAPDELHPVTVRALRHWPFAYAECATSNGRLIAVPVSRLTEIEWEGW